MIRADHMTHLYMTPLTTGTKMHARRGRLDTMQFMRSCVESADTVGH